MSNVSGGVSAVKHPQEKDKKEMPSLKTTATKLASISLGSLWVIQGEGRSGA